MRLPFVLLVVPLVSHADALVVASPLKGGGVGSALERRAGHSGADVVLAPTGSEVTGKSGAAVGAALTSKSFDDTARTKTSTTTGNPNDAVGASVTEGTTTGKPDDAVGASVTEGYPTDHPTEYPTHNPTAYPTHEPTAKPTKYPTPNPTRSPTLHPTLHPTLFPTLSPTWWPSLNPTPVPTAQPSLVPTRVPTVEPTVGSTADKSEDDVGAVTSAGDPHMINIKGDAFDIYRAGVWEFLRLPKDATVENSELSIVANVTHVGEETDKCTKALYITRFTLAGSWLKGSDIDVRVLDGKMHVSMGKHVLSTSSKPRFVGGSPHGYVRLDMSKDDMLTIKVGSAMIAVGIDQQPVHSFLNMQAKGLSGLGRKLGGLLGEDDHSWVSMRPASCSDAHRKAHKASEVHFD